MPMASGPYTSWVAVMTMRMGTPRHTGARSPLRSRTHARPASGPRAPSRCGTPWAWSAASGRTPCRGDTDRRSRWGVDPSTRDPGLGGQLGRHEQGVMTLGDAHLDALRAALAVAGVDEDAEGGGRQPRLAGTSAYFWVWTKCRRALAAAPTGSSWAPANAPMCPSHPLRHGDAQDGRIRAGADTGHASHAALRDQLGDGRGERAEVTCRGGAGRHDAACHTRIRGQLAVGRALAIRGDDGASEVLAYPCTSNRSPAAPRRASCASLGSPCSLTRVPGVERGQLRHRAVPSTMACTRSVVDRMPRAGHGRAPPPRAGAHAPVPSGPQPRRGSGWPGR